jgi:hypothetical protein
MRKSGHLTHNIVMFHARDIEITDRNDKPVAPEAWNAQKFYGQSQARTLEDLESEHSAERAAAVSQQRNESVERPGPAATREGNRPPVAESRGRPAGTPGGEGEGNGPRAPETDLLGKPVAEPKPKAELAGKPKARSYPLCRITR